MPTLGGRWQYQAKAEPVPVRENITADKWHRHLSEPVRKSVITTALIASSGMAPWVPLPGDCVFQFDAFQVEGPQAFQGCPQGYDETPWSQPPGSKSKSAALAASSGLTQAPFVPTEVVTVDKWFEAWQDPVRTKPGLAAALQRVFEIDPVALTNNTSEDRWHQPWSDPVRFRQLHVAYRPAATIDPVALTNNTSEDRWHQAWSTPVRVKVSLPAPAQHFFEFQPAPSPFVANGWYNWLSEPVRTKPGLAAWLQEFFPDNPFGLTQTTSEDRWHQAWSEPVRFRQLHAAYQMAAVIDPFALTLTTSEDKWHQPWSEPVRVKQALAASSQQFLALTLSLENVTVDKWFKAWQDPVRLKPGLGAPYQLAFAIDPTALTRPENVSEDKWHQPWSEPVRVKLALAPSSQQFLAFSPSFTEVITVDKWFKSWQEPIRVKPGLATAAQFTGAIDPFALTNNTSEDRWHQPWSEPVRLRQFGTAYQFTGAIDPFALTLNTSEDRWHQAWSEPVRTKPGLAPSAQQFLAFVPDLVFPDRWFKQWQDPVRLKPGLAAAYQSSAVIDPVALTNTTSEDRWHQPWSEPVRLKPALPTGEQQYQAQATALEVVTVDKWFRSWQEPVRVKPGLLTAAQSSAVISPFALTLNTSEDRYHPRWPDFAPRRTLHPDAYQFLAFNPQPFVPFDWRQWLSEPVRSKPGLAARYQLAFAISPFALTQTTSEDRWHQAWSEPVRAKLGLRPSAQQFLAFTHFVPSTEVVTADKWFASFREPVRSLPGLSRALVASSGGILPPPQPTPAGDLCAFQGDAFQVDLPDIEFFNGAFQGCPPPPPPPIPGAGKKPKVTGVYPDAPWEKKPQQKPVRPVWDRGRIDGEYEQPAPHPAPSSTPPLPPANLFAGAGAPLSPAVLPRFDHLAPPNPVELGHQMRGAMDRSDAVRVLGQVNDEMRDLQDALDVLRSIGLLKDQEE